MNSITTDQQECIGILPLNNSHRVVAYTRTQTDMPIAVQTTEKPVVLNIAPRQIFTDSEEETCRKFKQLNADLN